MMIVTFLLLTACESRGVFGTETRRAWCDALLTSAPTASRRDTVQTQTEVADIGEVIDTLCEETDE